MTLWRISIYQTLNGLGGMEFSGRWHTFGRPVAYLAESPAGALLEVLAHLDVDAEDVPDTFTLLKVEASVVVRVEDLPLPDRGDWRASMAATQLAGDTWLRSGSSALARVPSALVPQTSNYLLNPRHGQADHVALIEVFRDRYDLRLLGRIRRQIQPA